MKQVTACRCDHCGKLFMRDYNCRNHESQCTKNMLNRSLCYDCENYNGVYDKTEEVNIIRFDCMGSEYDTIQEFSPHRCTHPDKGCKLFANIHMSEDVYTSLREEGWEAMPTPKDGGCEYFKQHEYGKKREL